MMSFISLLVFVPLQIVFLPLTVLGTILVAYKQMVVSKRLGVSQTGIEILIAGAVVPMWVSVFGGIVTAGLAVALFREASGSPGAPEI